MAVIFVKDGTETWHIAGWAFRVLVDRALSLTSRADDRFTLTQAEALSGVHFDLLEPDEGRRIAHTVRAAARLLRGEIASRPLEHLELKDIEFADALASLDLLLGDLVNNA